LAVEHLDTAWSSAKEFRKKYLLDKLGEHNRLIQGVVGERPGSSSGHIRIDTFSDFL
jgi:hypothetical protein